MENVLCCQTFTKSFINAVSSIIRQLIDVLLPETAALMAFVENVLLAILTEPLMFDGFASKRSFKFCSLR